MSIADRIQAIEAADLTRARALLVQEAEMARDTVGRAASAATPEAIDDCLARLSDIGAMFAAVQAKL